jgi:NTE family protein
MPDPTPGSRHLPLPLAERTGTALCLSGGGFRATLFHTGALRRLNELGALDQIDTFVSVSGGSILNGMLSMHWNELKRLPSGVFENFDELITGPIHDFCKRDLRTAVLLWRRGNPINWLRLIGDDHSVTDLLADAYAAELGFGRRLDQLRPGRRFIVCAANLETGANWEFESSPEGSRMGDYRTGTTATGEVTLAQAVAASSAFPMAFPPLVLSFPNAHVFRGGSAALSDEARRSIPLTDGGVYDNLGLEPVWKSYRRVLASDAGMPFALKDNPGNGLMKRLRRCFDVVSNQSGALRKRWLVNMFQTKAMEGTYWGIDTDFRNYELAGAQGYDDLLRSLVEGIRTDLDAFTDGEIACLLNHGYALADAAIRRWLPDLSSAGALPFRWPDAAFAPDRSAAVGEALRRSGERGIMDDLWRSIFERVA